MNDDRLEPVRCVLVELNLLEESNHKSRHILAHSTHPHISKGLLSFPIILGNQTVHLWTGLVQWRHKTRWNLSQLVIHWVGDWLISWRNESLTCQNVQFKLCGSEVRVSSFWLFRISTLESECSSPPTYEDFFKPVLLASSVGLPQNKGTPAVAF